MNTQENWLKDLQEQKPCPAELESIKHLFYRPLTIQSEQTKKYLKDGGAQGTAFKVKKFSDSSCHWVLYPQDGKVFVKPYVTNLYNLQMFPAAGTGYACVAEDPSQDKTEWQSFDVQKSENDTWYFFNVETQKYMGQKEGAEICCCEFDKVSPAVEINVTFLGDHVEVEKEVEVVEYDEEMQKQYPCPQSLEFAKHIFYTPVVILGVQGKLIQGDGQKTRFKGIKAVDKPNQFVIYPIQNGNVAIKAVSNDDHLEMWCDESQNKGTAWANCAPKSLGTEQQFKIEFFPIDTDKPDDQRVSFVLRSALNMKVLHLETINKIAASTEVVCPQSELKILNLIKAENDMDDIIEITNQKFDAYVQEQIEKNWGIAVTEFKAVKRDYNIVYKLLFENGQACFAKAKPLSNFIRESHTKQGREEMFFVNYVSEKTDGIASKFYDKGNLELEWLYIQVFTAAKGCQPIPYYQNEEVVVSIGQQLGKFHNAAKQFKKDHPEEYAAMRDYTTCVDGVFKDLKMQSLPKDDDDWWGICHGDFHEQNYHVDVENNNKINIFDWDILAKSWFIVDLGTIVQGKVFLNQFMSQEPQEVKEEQAREFTKWVLDGYCKETGTKVTSDLLIEACNWRVQFVRKAIAFIVEEGFQPGIEHFMVMLDNWVADGTLDFKRILGEF